VKFNWTVVLSYLGLASQVVGDILGVVGSISTGSPVTTPPFKTYINGKHVEISVNVNPVP
jgi:hypothetical protein